MAVIRCAIQGAVAIVAFILFMVLVPEIAYALWEATPAWVKLGVLVAIVAIVYTVCKFLKNLLFGRKLQREWHR